MVLGAVLCSAAAAAAGGNERTAASYLEFESRLDARCQILSEGGKLRIMWNTNSEQDIRYRLVRIFAGTHRQGLTVGIAAAGGDPVELGCTRVDGRDQDWIIERAAFVGRGK